MTCYSIILTAHVGAGTLALGSFWTTAALRKGTALHQRTGGTYMLAMVAVMLTALPLAEAAFATGQSATGVFLSYLILITATAVWGAWRAVRDRRSPQVFMGSWYRPVAWINLGAGAVVSALGVYFGALLLVGMSLIGLAIGRQMLSFAAHPPAGRTWWLKRHYTGIVASGIATHIAFLNIGLQRVVPHGHATAVFYFSWFGPVIVAVASIIWLDRRYGRGADGTRLAHGVATP
jgi:hypothetical protein